MLEMLLGKSDNYTGPLLYIATSEMHVQLDENGYERRTIDTGTSSTITALVITPLHVYIEKRGSHPVTQKYSHKGVFVEEFDFGPDLTLLDVDYEENFYFRHNTENIRKYRNDGLLLWENTDSSSYVSRIAIDINGNVSSIAAGGDNSLRRINRWGNQEWRFTWDTGGSPSSVAVDTNGYTYFGTGRADVRKVDSGGNLVWTFLGHTGFFVDALAVDENGFVYSGGRDGLVKKINPNGYEVWSNSTHRDFNTGTEHTDNVRSIALDVNGNVYSASQTGLIKLDPNGNFLENFGAGYRPNYLGVTPGLYGAGFR